MWIVLRNQETHRWILSKISKGSIEVLQWDKNSLTDFIVTTVNSDFLLGNNFISIGTLPTVKFDKDSKNKVTSVTDISPKLTPLLSSLLFRKPVSSLFSRSKIPGSEGYTPDTSPTALETGPRLRTLCVRSKQKRIKNRVDGLIYSNFQNVFDSVKSKKN